MDPRAADVKFLVGPQKRVIEGNKGGLAYASTVFYRMFFSDFPSENEIEVPDVDADAFELMINSVSGRYVIIGACNVAQVYYAAEKYNLPSLGQICKTFVVNSIDSKTALTILNTYQQYNDSEINEKCLAIILNDPLSFLRKTEFLEAPADVVRSIFKPTHINCSTQDIEKALKDWMTKNEMVNNNDEWSIFEAVENKLKITRAELELKKMCQNVFAKSNFNFSQHDIYHVSFDLGDTPLSLLGFGLIFGKILQETFTATICHGKNLELQCEIKITVENKRPTDEFSIQNVFIERIPISHSKLKVQIFYHTYFKRPYFNCVNNKTCLAYLLVSNIDN
jgi:BTB/POZ domain